MRNRTLALIGVGLLATGLVLGTLSTALAQPQGQWGSGSWGPGGMMGGYGPISAQQASPQAPGGEPTHEQMDQMMDAAHGEGTAQRMHEAMGQGDAQRGEQLMQQCVDMMGMMQQMQGMMGGNGMSGMMSGR